ncbi:hypothetical protein LXL04_038482 [Taraxacum kok-saghyz]
MKMKMTNFHLHDHGSLVLNPAPATADVNYNLWSSFRCKIIDAIRCSGGISRTQKSVKSTVAEIPKLEDVKAFIPERRSDAVNGNHKGSGKLSTLMRMLVSSSEEEQNVKLKEVVKRLQIGMSQGGEGALIQIPKNSKS